MDQMKQLWSQALDLTNSKDANSVKKYIIFSTSLLWKKSTSDCWSKLKKIDSLQND
jgi:hypothetical protein